MVSPENLITRKLLTLFKPSTYNPCNTVTDNSIIEPTTSEIRIHFPFLGKYETKLTNSFIWKISPLLNLLVNLLSTGKLLMLTASSHLKTTHQNVSKLCCLRICNIIIIHFPMMTIVWSKRRNKFSISYRSSENLLF